MKVMDMQFRRPKVYICTLSSAGQSICLTSKGSQVRILQCAPKGSPQSLLVEAKSAVCLDYEKIQEASWNEAVSPWRGKFHLLGVQEYPQIASFLGECQLLPKLEVLAAIAQLVKHLVANQKTAGSNPVCCSMWPQFSWQNTRLWLWLSRIRVPPVTPGQSAHSKRERNMTSFLSTFWRIKSGYSDSGYNTCSPKFIKGQLINFD